MKIGIDIDGTITTPYYWLEFFNKHFNKSLEGKDIKSYEYYPELDITKEEFIRFRSENLEKIHNLADLRLDAAAYINLLYFEDMDTHIITAREEKLTPLTKKWLQKNGVVYKGLYHLGTTAKTNLALQLELDVFIEDRFETAMDMVNCKIPTILFNTHYNQLGHHPMIYRVNTWKEAYNILKSIDLKKKDENIASEFIQAKSSSQK